MVLCKCGKSIDKIPEWLNGVKVDFICNNCPNRQTKNIAFISLDPEIPAVAKLDMEIDPSEDLDETD